MAQVASASTRQRQPWSESLCPGSGSCWVRVQVQVHWQWASSLGQAPSLLSAAAAWPRPPLGPSPPAGLGPVSSAGGIALAGAGAPQFAAQWAPPFDLAGRRGPSLGPSLGAVGFAGGGELGNLPLSREFEAGFLRPPKSGLPATPEKPDETAACQWGICAPCEEPRPVARRPCDSA